MIIPSPLTRFFRICLLGASAGLFGSNMANARIFEPSPAPAPLQADDKTEALYEFQEDALKSGKISDVTKKCPPGVVGGSWKFVNPEELKPNYAGAGKVLGASKEKESGAGKKRAVVVFPDLKALNGGAFSVDVVMRWSRGGGYFLSIGGESDPLLVGVLHRGPGLFELRVPVKTAGGGTKVETLASDTIYEEAGPVRFDDFYTYSLTFDGKGLFQLFIDGQKAFEGRLPEGEVFQASKTLAVGNVAQWKSPFSGEIAAVRVSSGARDYKGSHPGEAKFDRKEQSGWIFDAGTGKSPVASGAIRLTQSELYGDSSKRGYGWAAAPKGDFDGWYVAGRYAPTPEASYKKGEHKILDALQRDGVILKGGEIFRADVPDGKYWVSLEIGNNRGGCNVASISANGTVLGEHLLANCNIHNNNIIGRTARGLVTVEGGKGLLIKAQAANKDGEIPVKSIEILPYAPLPVVVEKGQLKWHGPGIEPKELNQVSQAMATGHLEEAVAEAKKISDPFVAACVLAQALGQPKMPLPGDIAVAAEVRQLLLRAVREQPKNTAARWLLDSTERFRHGLIAYLDEGGDDVAYGSRFALWLAVPNLGLQLRPEDPEYWQGRLLAGAGIWQIGQQSSAFDTSILTDTYKFPERMPAFDAPGKLFAEIAAAYPNFRIARIMRGEQLMNEDAANWKAPDGAPQWAVLQVQLLRRILDITHYWANKMDDKGLMGGGIGDDCEALRWWWPAVLVAADRPAIDGWTRMAETAWSMTQGVGYTASMDDVEHSSETTADTLPILAINYFGTDKMPMAQERLGKTLPLFRNLWTVTTPDGYRMFKGYHLNATKIEREGDVPYNIRAIKPLMWAAWMDNGANQELKDTLVAYAKNWRDATMAEFDGKPRGIVPMMIKLDRKRSHEPEAKDWVAPGYSTYKYPGYSSKIYDLMFAAYQLSGDKSFLEPIQFALDKLRAIPDADLESEKYPVGSFDWAIRAGVNMISAAGGSYRSITGDKTYDDVLLRIGSAPTKFQIMAERAKAPADLQSAMEPVIERLGNALKLMNCNQETLTVMVQSTDRIYVKGSMLVYAMATGGAGGGTELRGDELAWPTFHITWQGADSDVAAMVQDASPAKLDVLLYNFSDKAKSLSPRLWQLAPGTYDLVISETDASGFKAIKQLDKREVKIDKRGQVLDFGLPPHVPAKMQLVRK